MNTFIDQFGREFWLLAGVGLGAALLVALVSYLVLRRTTDNTARVAVLEQALRESAALAAGSAEAVQRLESEKTDREKRAMTERADAERRLNEVAARLDEARVALADREKELARLIEARERDAEATALRVKELTDAREQMTKEFKLLAEQVMTSHGQTFKQQNREQLDSLLNPLRQKIVEFQTGMNEAQKSAAVGRARLAEQIELLGRQSNEMTQETLNLTRALKGDSQVRGAWGEMVLSRLLEISGLRPEQEFVTQESETLEDGTRLRPDVIVNLPGDRRLIIDSKLSLVAYEQHANAEDEAARRVHLQAHVAAVKTHIRQLSRKDYTQAFGMTPDYVIMFVPIEGAFAAVLEAEPDLTETALRQNITLSAPTTLVTILRSVAHLWQVERQYHNAEEIANRAGLLYDKFEGFVGDMGMIRKRLDDATQAHDQAMNKLTTGRGNLVRQVESLKDLGAKARKALDRDMVEKSGAAMLERPDT